ncbi:hypothetical protein FB45DRAFT_68485 [Roridomyces roridus]|uniref:F-box domain-containing protein n=1 Tax=Roridomyces roridus TaxID=1738132 RepID=A0AAD7BMG7_9AGAR|nr:hypothetical protein FB45DRAFT_68485 [Roridomyces roridus]
MVHHRTRTSKSKSRVDHSIWRTNSLLSRAEASQVADLLLHAEAELRTAQEHDRALLTAQIDSYKIALAPHKNLPPEVLGLIFTHAVGTPIILPPSKDEPCLAIAGTCRLWRSVILNVPHLWCNIFLDFSYCPHPVKLLQYAKLWLSRSENTSITLRNSTSRWSETRMQQLNVHPIMDLVAPYLGRCREIDMRFFEASIDEFFTFPAGSIDRLEVLYLETLGFSMPFGSVAAEPLEVFRSAPSLRHVLFSTDLCSIDPNVLGLPWAQLTSLHFIATYIPPLAMHAILRESTSLVECSCSIIQLDSTLSAALARLPECTLPALRTLMVEFSPQTTDYAPFLRPLVLPALTDLELRPLEAGFLPQCLWSQPAYTGLLARSRFRLNRLAILHYMVDAVDLEAILVGMPDLRELHLYLWERTEWDEGILNKLGEGEILPNLETLTFSTYPLGGVLDALERRVAGAGRRVAKLKALNMAVTWRHDVPEDQMARFMRLAEGGGPECRAFTHTRAYAHDRTSTQIRIS